MQMLNGPDKDARKKARKIRKLIENSPKIEKSMTVYKVARPYSSGFKVGDKIEQKCFNSSSISCGERLLKFGQSNGTNFLFKLNVDSKLAMAIGDYSAFPREQEVLIRDNVVFSVTKVKQRYCMVKDKWERVVVYNCDVSSH